MKPAILQMMGSWRGVPGFPRICDKVFYIGSPCTQRIVIDVVNLIFVIAFFLVMIVGSMRKHYSSGGRARNWVFSVASACCVVSGISYLGAGLLYVWRKNDGVMYLDWVGYLVRGVVWMILAVSLNIQRTKWGRIVSSVWWIVYSVLISALNVEFLVKSHSVRVLDMATWPVNFLLLFCSYDAFTQLFSKNNLNQSFSQPLPIEDGETRVESSKASFISRLAFSWINPLLRLGYSRPLVFEDIPTLESEDEAHFAYAAFAHELDLQRKQSSNTSNLVLRALAKCYMKEMILVGVLAFLRTVAVVASPLLLYAFVSYSARKERNLYDGLMLVGCLIFVKIVESLSQRHWYFGARRFGMRMRSSVMVAIFRKLLKLSSSGRQKHSTGEIVNYIAVDAYRLGEFPWWFHTAWTLPLQLVLAIGVLFGTVGLGALPGLVPLIICGFLNIPLAKFRQKCQSKFMEAQDRRLRATSEVLNNMKIIKLQSWEEKFKNLIDSLRDVEFKWLAESQIKKSYGTALYWMSPMFVSSVVLASCVVMRSAPFNASTIFTVLATLRVMSEPAKIVPEALSVLIQVKVSLDRLNIFLLDDELKEEDVKRIPHQYSHFSVRVDGGLFSWDPDAAVPTLKGVNLEIGRGQKIAICGPVGAGKSSLLCALLGEIPKISGSVEVLGSIAYVSQTAWIQSGTIRDNILYGKPMNKGRYNKAIKVCALDKDIDSFDHGDLTEIGQRGLNLSGGQKQRLQLARAFYNDADIYLLDDPFSAVDAHTAAILFNVMKTARSMFGYSQNHKQFDFLDCIKVALEEKTVILVTHQVEFLAGSDRILRSSVTPLVVSYMCSPKAQGPTFPPTVFEMLWSGVHIGSLVIEGGQVTQSGSYTELLKAGTAFEKLVNAHHDAMTVLDTANMVQICEDRSADGDEMDLSRSPSTKENGEGGISSKGISTIQLTEDEEKEIGDVGWKPYVDYVRVSKGSILLAAFIFFQTAFVILQAASTYWLAIAVQTPHIASAIVIGVYAGISAFSGIFVYLRIFFAAHLGLKASKAFFSSLMNSVFKAPMLFFDSTPVGRILTRASSDMSVLDLDIPFALAFALSGLIDVITTILVMATVTWQVLLVAIPIILAARYFQGYYLASARELMRINGTTKAPVMNYAAETSLGVVTIRAFSTMERFIQNNLKLIDTDAALFFHTNAAMEWVLLRVETLQNLTIFTATLLLVLLPPGTIAPGFVGLSLSYALTLTSAQVILTRWHCNLENYIISVERIKQYMHIPSEPPAIVDDKRPLPSWPFGGKIDLQDLKIRYRPNAPLVLKGITCTFQAGNRVGVVGRTGSGKTTLISALFRLVEPDCGRILIDGLDICSIGLKDLRMKLSIIPQEPALFRGSIRSNLDPLCLHSNHEIWEALEKCQLAAAIRCLPKLLDSSVSDDGENWSAGQRQLFCLGRVLLKRNRILILDEATASIDSATDAILQRVIRQEFASCTVITVAHRVPTVTDSDMVMVLSYGKLIEYDKPSKLMETDSSFSKLVAEYWSNCNRNPRQNQSSVH